MDMGSDEKPIINLTMFIKVRYLLSIIPLVHKNGILSHTPYGKNQNNRHATSIKSKCLDMFTQ